MRVTNNTLRDWWQNLKANYIMTAHITIIHHWSRENRPLFLYDSGDFMMRIPEDKLAVCINKWQCYALAFHYLYEIHWNNQELFTIYFEALYGYCTNSDRYGCYREGQHGCLPPVMSGKLKSKSTIRFGKVEVRARIPRGEWLWPGKSTLSKSR